MERYTKKAYLNLIDTINCVEIATRNPPRMENLEFLINLPNLVHLTKWHKKIKLFAEKNRIKSGIKHVINPRIEGKDSIITQNTSLISLGLKPVMFDENQIKKIYNIVKKNINRINLIPKTNY